MQVLWAAERAVPTDTPEGHRIATFAGGCFWGPQLLFERIPGIVMSSVGYTQGASLWPSYSSICSGQSGHTEAVQVFYDEKKVSYQELLDVFWASIDSAVMNGQGYDRGAQYRTGVYYHGEEQGTTAKASLVQQQQKLSPAPVATEVRPAKVFYPAEQEHQAGSAKHSRAQRVARIPFVAMANGI